MLRRFVLALGFLLAPYAAPALAQTPVVLWCPTGLSGANQWSVCNTTYPLSVNASATITGFAPGGSYANLTSSASSADVALPTGAVVAAFNTGTTAVSCKLGVGTQTAVANQNIIQPSSWFSYTVGSNTHIACINQAGDSASNVVVVSGGSGIPTGSGGGGGGSGGAVTIADGADVAEGQTNQAACNTDNGTCSNNQLLKRIAQNLTTVNTTAQTGTGTTGAAVPAAAVYQGFNSEGNIVAPITCPHHAFKHITSATDTVALQGVTAKTIYVCAWRSRAAGTATWYWENTASTNNNCSSTLTQISGVATEAANTGEAVNLPLGMYLANTSGNGLCINSTGTGGVDIDFWYAQF